MAEKNYSVSFGTPFKNAVFKVQWATICMKLNPTRENKLRFKQAVEEMEMLGVH